MTVSNISEYFLESIKYIIIFFANKGDIANCFPFSLSLISKYSNDWARLT